jgi:hypothetical protein
MRPDTRDGGRVGGVERGRPGHQRSQGGREASVGLGGVFRGLLAVGGVLLREVAVRAGRDGAPRAQNRAA